MSVLEPDLLERLNGANDPLSMSAVAAITKLTDALAFYANRDAWNQPPVKISDGLFGPAYENAASQVQKDRGRRAREVLEDV